MPTSPEFDIHTPDGTRPVKFLPADLAQMASDIDDALAAQRAQTADDRARAELAATRAEAVGDTNDSIMAGVAADPESLFAATLPAAIRGPLTDALSDDPSILEAAAELAQDTANLVHRTDTGVTTVAPVRLSNGASAISVEYNARGRVLSYTSTSGAVAVTQQQVGDAAITAAPVRNAYPFGFYTPRGRASENMVGADGLLFDSTLLRGARRVRELEGWAGTFVYQADSFGTTSPGGVAIPDLLATESGHTIIADGNSGWTSGEVSLKSGGLALYLRFPDNIIPATTAPITVEAWVDRNPLWQAGARTFPHDVLAADGVTLIRGNLGRSAAGVYTWSRVAAGAATAVDPDTRMLPVARSYLRLGHIVDCGRNDITSTTLGDPGSSPADVVANIRAIRDAMPVPRSSPFMVLSTINRVDEPYSTDPASGYARVMAVNAAKQEAFDWYFDRRTALIRRGLAVVGLEATPTDLAAIGEDRIPPSLMYASTPSSDLTHLNAVGKLADARLQTRFLIERKALNA